jgi:uncharacterized repeat protein (TIGR01451 family)
MSNKNIHLLGGARMNKFKMIGGLFSLALMANESMALGTQAGTSIENQATVTYTAGAGTVSAASGKVYVTVQELINANIVSQDSANVSISSPQTNAYLKFQLTNTGNGDEGFAISQQNLTGADNFDVTFSNAYIDDGDGIFDPAIDTLYDNSNPQVLAPDASMVIWVASTVPSGISDGNTADVQVTALSKTFSDDGQTSPSAGAVVNGQGDAATDAVMGTSGANADDDATFIVSDIDVAIVKAISAVRDNLGGGAGNQPVPGAEVDYTLTVTVTGTGDADNISVSDPLPTELKLKDGITGVITVGGVAETASSADSDGTSYDANTNTITVDLCTVTAGDPAIAIQFTTVIQ